MLLVLWLGLVAMRTMRLVFSGRSPSTSRFRRRIITLCRSLLSSSSLLLPPTSQPNRPRLASQNRFVNSLYEPKSEGCSDETWQYSSTGRERAGVPDSRITCSALLSSASEACVF